MARAEPDAQRGQEATPAGRDDGRPFGRRSAVQSPSEALQPRAAPPPPQKQRRRRPRGGILSTISGVLSFVLVLAIGAALAFVLGGERFLAPGPLQADKVVFIARGTGTGDTIDQLERESVIDNSLMFSVGLLAYGQRSSIKAGEYFFRAHVSPYEVMNTLASPRSQQISLTLNNQMTKGQLVQLVEHFMAPGPLGAEKDVSIAQGSRTDEIVDQLQQEGVIADAAEFSASLPVFGKRGKLTGGDYRFKAHASPFEVMNQLVAGSSAAAKRAADASGLSWHSAYVQHSVTLPEGLTSEQIVQRLKSFKDEDDKDLLTGEVHVPHEGELMPDTYAFVRGDSRESIIKEMQEEHKRVLNEIWAHRAADLPIKSPFELVVLASIVEKETGKADERARIAGVFVNRLNRHMKLQSDPTIVYGLVGGKGTLGRGILKSELTEATPYNTYVIDGLPPGPICNPGRAAMEGAANPARTNELYFVADGTGGHAFAETVEEHLKNVARWRQIENSPKDALPPGLDKPAVPPPAKRTERLDEGGTSRQAAAAADDRQAAGPAAPAGNADVLAFKGFNLDIGPTIEKIAAHIVGIDVADDAAAAPLQGEDSVQAIGKGPVASYPISPARLADLRARALRWGLDPGSSTTLPPGLTGAASADARPPTRAPPCHVAAADAQPRPRAFDASEGTPLDPLLNKSFDLSSSKTVPAVPILLASLSGDAGLKSLRARADGLRADTPRPAAPDEGADCAADRRGRSTTAADVQVTSAGPDDPAPAGGRPRAFDASEGTRLDPLLNKSYDLNSPHSVPSKPIAADGLEQQAPLLPALHAGAAPPPPGPADDAPRPKGFDASEGTRLDPLRNKTYDLNSPQTVPTRPISYDAVARAAPAPQVAALETAAQMSDRAAPIVEAGADSIIPLPVPRPQDAPAAAVRLPSQPPAAVAGARPSGVAPMVGARPATGSRLETRRAEFAAAPSGGVGLSVVPSGDARATAVYGRLDLDVEAAALRVPPQTAAPATAATLLPAAPPARPVTVASLDTAARPATAVAVALRPLPAPRLAGADAIRHRPRLKDDIVVVAPLDRAPPVPEMRAADRPPPSPGVTASLELGSLPPAAVSADTVARPRVVQPSPWAAPAIAKPSPASLDHVAPAAGRGAVADPNLLPERPSSEPRAITGAALAAIRPTQAPRLVAPAPAPEPVAVPIRRRRHAVDIDKNFDLNSAKVIPDL